MILEDLATFLESQGLATRGVDLWLHVSPDMPNECAILVEYAGDDPDWVMENRKADTENPRVQLGVRSEQPEVARLRAERMYQAMMTIRNDIINGTRYLWCRPVDSPTMIGRDDSGRFMATVNFMVQKELTSV